MELKSNRMNPTSNSSTFTFPFTQAALRGTHHQFTSKYGGRHHFGDFNALHSLWFTTLTEDVIETNISREIDDCDFAVLNENLPTRLTTT